MQGGDAVSDPCVCFVSGADPGLDRDMLAAAHRTMLPVDSLAATMQLERVFLSRKPDPALATTCRIMVFSINPQRTPDRPDPCTVAEVRADFLYGGTHRTKTDLGTAPDA